MREVILIRQLAWYGRHGSASGMLVTTPVRCKEVHSHLWWRCANESTALGNMRTARGGRGEEFSGLETAIRLRQRRREDYMRAMALDCRLLLW